MGAPVVEIADILGQDPLQMTLVKYENLVQALGPDRSDPALGDGIGSRRSERCANLGNTNIAHPTIECGAITTVAVMNEKSWRLAPVPLRKAAVNELVSLKPTVNAISVTEDEGFTNSVLACSMRRLV